MKKILLVIRREYSTRVRKKSFWILTILVPILIGVVYAIPILLAQKPLEESTVLVVDQTGIFERSFHSTKEVKYFDAGSLEYAQGRLKEGLADLIVFIPSRETTIPNDAFLYYLSDAPGIAVQSDVDRQLQEILRNNILLDVHNISVDDYELITNTKIKLHTKDIETGRDGFLEIKLLAGALLALIIFMAIFMFGGQVMQGVMEEKQSRIVEVIMCSVKPFQLMMGKVVGIGLVGLTQFLLWVLLSGVALLGVQLSNPDLFEQAIARQNLSEVATKGTDMMAQMEAAQAAQDAVANSAALELVQGLVAINFPLLVTMFFIYFLFGYLLYASLFAACGALVDQGTDGQQFTLPLTVPLLLTILLLPAMVNEPSGTLSMWLSIIPFTSPIAMVFRIPFGVPIVQVVLSVVLLVIAFPLCTWVASKIYRRGILLYGKKISYKDIFSWFRR